MTLVFSILLSWELRHGGDGEILRGRDRTLRLSVGSSGVQAAPGGAGDQGPVGASLSLFSLSSEFPPPPNPPSTHAGDCRDY